MNLRTQKRASQRRKILEEHLGISLPNIGSCTLDEDIAGTRNCENMIGAAQIPLGVAGPLFIKFQERPSVGKTSNFKHYSMQKRYYIPLATTEGALVASVSRGCKAVTESGGATVLVENAGATRGPVFRMETMGDSLRFEAFLQKYFSEIKQIGESTSRHVTLKSYTTAGAGKYRFVRFVFDTGDAMGLNMITIATDAMVRFIEEKTKIRCISVSGNYCVDKKSSWLNVIEKRGRPVMAEVTVPSAILQSVLKTTAEKLYETWLAKCMIGSALGGSVGFNAHFANVITALYLATGQDPAHVVEGSVGMTTTEVQGKALFISVMLPDLMVGTVGGGTGLATQKEALSILQLSEKNPADELAGAVGATVLSGELSLLASLSEGTLAKAHASLARGKI